MVLCYSSRKENKNLYEIYARDIGTNAQSNNGLRDANKAEFILYSLTKKFTNSKFKKISK